jgi:hypothetical protein
MLILVPRQPKSAGWGGPRPGAGRPKHVEDPVRLTFDLEREDAEELKAIGDETGRSLASLMRESVGALIRSYRRKGR